MVSLCFSVSLLSLQLQIFCDQKDLTLKRCITSNWFWNLWAHWIQQESVQLDTTMFVELVLPMSIRNFLEAKPEKQKQKLSLRDIWQKCRATIVQSGLVAQFWKLVSELISQHYLQSLINYSQHFFFPLKKKKKKRKLNKQVLEGHTSRWMKVYILCALFLWKPLSRKLTGTKLSTAAVFMLLFIFRMVDMKVCSPWRPGLWLCLTSVKCHPSSRFIINPKMIETVGKAGQMLWPWPKERQLSHALPSNNPGSCLSIITKWACFLPNPF